MNLPLDVGDFGLMGKNETSDFPSLQELLAERLLAFERHYQTIAQPFEWRFTRKDLNAWICKLHRPMAKAA
jgi:hypothetical protein